MYIWIRSTTDWTDERAFAAQLDAAFKPKVEVWNATFDVPFHVFRHEVRRIAALNHARVEGARVASWDDIPDGALVLPVDDDDWFAPHAATVLEAEADRRALAYRWISSYLEVPIDVRHALGRIRRRLFPHTAPQWICTTNNYAVVKRADSRALLANHMTASAWCAGQGGTVKQIEHRLSVMNRTLASQTSLGLGRTTIGRSELVRKFRRYRPLYRAPLAPELAWCRPYADMMAALMERVRLLPRA